MSPHMVHCGEHQNPTPQETAVGFLCADTQGETSKTDEKCSRHRTDMCKRSGPSAITRTEREASAEGRREPGVWLQAWERGEDGHKSRLISLIEGCSLVGHRESSGQPGLQRKWS